MGKKGVLLGLVESVDLIHKDDGGGLFAVEQLAALLHYTSNLFDPGEHGGEKDKIGVGDFSQQSGQGGLTGAGRPP